MAILQQTQSKTTKQPNLQGAHLSLLWLQRSHSARLSEKEKGQYHKSYSTESQPTPKSNSVHSAKQTVSLGIEEHSSHLAGPTTSTIDELLMDSGATAHMTSDKTILHDVKPSSSQISIGDASSIEASCVGNVFLNTSPFFKMCYMCLTYLSTYFRSTESLSKVMEFTLIAQFWKSLTPTAYKL